MMARWLAFLVWAAVAASAVFWGLKFFVRPAPPPAHAGVAAVNTALRGDLTRLLGVDPPPKVVEAPMVAESSRFQLIGVVAPRSAPTVGQGVALIAVDGKPPRAYKVGAVIDGQQVLQSVQQRGVSIGPRGGAVAIALDLPPLAPAATGSLPSATGSPPPVAGNPPPPSPAATFQPPRPGFVAPTVAPNLLPNQIPAARPPMPGMPRFPPTAQPGAPGGADAASTNDNTATR